MIALAAEAAGPVRGIFGAWDQQSLSLFGASALILIACAAVSCLHAPNCLLPWASLRFMCVASSQEAVH